MAKTDINTEETRWTSAEYNLSVARLAWAAVKGDMDCSARQQVALALDDAKNILYSVPAPDISGVRQKLTVWWGESLFDEDDYECHLNRILIGDLTRIQLQLLGVEEAEASGRTLEEAAEHAEQWRSTVAEYLDLENMLIEGPSPRWEGRSGIDLVDKMYNVAGALFELPAPNLHGVIRKLGLMWDVERFVEDDTGIFYLQIVRDMNRLSGAANPAISEPL